MAAAVAVWASCNQQSQRCQRWDSADWVEIYAPPSAAWTHLDRDPLNVAAAPPSVPAAAVAPHTIAPHSSAALSVPDWTSDASCSAPDTKISPAPAAPCPGCARSH